MEGVLHELRDGTAPSQQQHPGIGPDKRSGHGTQDGDDLQEQAALQFVHGVGISQEDPEEQGCQGDDKSHLDGVDQGRKVIGFPKELLKIGK